MGPALWPADYGADASRPLGRWPITSRTRQWLPAPPIQNTASHQCGTLTKEHFYRLLFVFLNQFLSGYSTSFAPWLDATFGLSSQVMCCRQKYSFSDSLISLPDAATPTLTLFGSLLSLCQIQHWGVLSQSSLCDSLISDKLHQMTASDVTPSLPVCSLPQQQVNNTANKLHIYQKSWVKEA